jgi:hypothetical protein
MYDRLTYGHCYNITERLENVQRHLATLVTNGQSQELREQSLNLIATSHIHVQLIVLRVSHFTKSENTFPFSSIHN